VQAMGSGDVKGLAELRQIVKRSFPVTTTDPRPDPRWDEAYHLFKSCGS
jgi:hypothetical protein